ncbi:DUF4383 domain-containing protein [Kineococcus auxinigenes]|uniref:DUF4383 domain-containing protein n=1 Tax=unclassified Kineococcus TaxID=2621656 RepID=UPI003D7DF1E5
MSATRAVEAAKKEGGPVRRHAQITGVVLMVLGVLGLIPGITTNYDQMGFFRSGAELFGVFTVCVLTSVGLFLFGVTVLAFSGSVRQAHKNVILHALALIAMGITGAGLVVNSPHALLPTDIESNWLYLALGVVFLVGGNRARAKEIKENGVF